MVLAKDLGRNSALNLISPFAENTLRKSRMKPNERNGCQDLRERTVKGNQWEMLFHSTESFMFSSWKMTG
jgi:hypothetical protein